MKSITNSEQVLKAIELLYKIKNQKFCDFTVDFNAYSCVNEMAISLFYPEWESNMSPTVQLSIQLKDGYIKENKDAISKLEAYAAKGLESEPIVIAKNQQDLAAKKQLLAKLQKELSA